MRIAHAVRSAPGALPNSTVSTTSACGSTATTWSPSTASAAEVDAHGTAIVVVWDSSSMSACLAISSPSNASDSKQTAWPSSATPEASKAKVTSTAPNAACGVNSALAETSSPLASTTGEPSAFQTSLPETS